MISRIIQQSSKISNTVKNLNNQSQYSFGIKHDINKKHFVLQYQYVEDIHYKRVPHRENHQKLIEKFEKKDNLIFGGSLFPNEGAFLLFNCNDETVPHEFLKNDPYYKNGLVTEWSIKELELHTRTEFKELAKIYAYR